VESRRGVETVTPVSRLAASKVLSATYDSHEHRIRGTPTKDAQEMCARARDLDGQLEIEIGISGPEGPWGMTRHGAPKAAHGTPRAARSSSEGGRGRLAVLVPRGVAFFGADGVPQLVSTCRRNKPELERQGKGEEAYLELTATIYLIGYFTPFDIG
jgi:hypothetical protein